MQKIDDVCVIFRWCWTCFINSKNFIKITESTQATVRFLTKLAEEIPFGPFKDYKYGQMNIHSCCNTLIMVSLLSNSILWFVVHRQYCISARVGITKGFLSSLSIDKDWTGLKVDGCHRPIELLFLRACDVRRLRLDPRLSKHGHLFHRWSHEGYHCDSLSTCPLISS